MKKIIILLLLLCSAAWAMSLNNLIIGKWNVTEMKGDKSFYFQAVFNNKTYIEMSGDEMRSYPYEIKNDALCIQGQCDKVVVVSENEFYVPKQNMKFSRVK